MPTASITRSPKALTSRPLNGAAISRAAANALMTALAAVLLTPKWLANSGIAGATTPNPSATMNATIASAVTSVGSSRRDSRPRGSRRRGRTRQIMPGRADVPAGDRSARQPGVRGLDHALDVRGQFAGEDVLQAGFVQNAA